jgi:peptidoglycan/LPS O-acetylase OafA/YrhL
VQYKQVVSSTANEALGRKNGMKDQERFFLNCPPRFYLLDILRGLASFAVVIWHYQHFYYVAPGTLNESFDRTAQPFFENLAIFYTSGAQAVKLFFVLSGFIFFWLYEDRVRRKAISPGRFFVLRFSRLYPLHLATLLLVAFGQAVAHHQFGDFIVYPHNDAGHFVLNLLFASHWGLQSGWSFNAPVWSVSIEILLYALFFVFVSVGGRSHLSMLLIMLIGLIVALLTSWKGLGFGIFCFFAGGLSYRLFGYLRKRDWFYLLSGRITLLVILSTLGLSQLAYLTSGLLSTIVLYAGVFPATVLSLSLSQLRLPSIGRRLRVIGDISYATYLLHFPLQLYILILAAHIPIVIDFNSESTFIYFFTSLTAISILVYYYFELPIQRYLRRRMLGKKKYHSRPKSSGR